MGHEAILGLFLLISDRIADSKRRDRSQVGDGVHIDEGRAFKMLYGFKIISPKNSGFENNQPSLGMHSKAKDYLSAGTHSEQ
jgi:hypothetical protein